jgi:hypothetical protein
MDAMIISVCFVFSKQLRALYCFVITTAVGGANIQHRRYRYYAVGIKSVSPPNRLVTRHRINDHQRWIVVQGDNDQDLCTGGSYAEVTVVLTYTDISAVEATVKLHRRQSGQSTR